MNTPVAPAGLTASNVTNCFSLQLSWTTSSGATSYVIYRQLNAGGAWTRIATTTQTSYSDTELTPATSYTYEVFACNKCGYSNGSIVTKTTCCLAPTAVNDLVAVPSSTSVALDWTSTNTNAYYVIKRQFLCTGSFVTVGTTSLNVTSFIDTGLPTNTTVCYQVIATNACSAASAVSVSTATSCSLPAQMPPPELSLNPAFPNTQIIITWDNTLASFYVLSRTVGAITTVLGSFTNFTYTDTGLIPNTEYQYTIKAFNSCGGGTASDPAFITTAAAPLCGSPSQTFTWQVANIGEPGWFAIPNAASGAINDTTYYHESADGLIDISDPNITGIRFSASSVLDDVLIMMPAGKSVTQVDMGGQEFDSLGNIIVGRKKIRYLIPQNSIIFFDTIGYFINNDVYVNGTLLFRRTTERWFDEVDAQNNVLHEWHMPQGDFTNGGTGHATDFAAAGFTTANFIDGIPKQTAIDKGFVDANGVFSFRFAHIICGTGMVNIVGMTCQSSITCTGDPVAAPISVQAFTGPNNTVDITWHNNATNAFGFVIQRSLNGDSFQDLTEVPVTTNSYIDTVARGATVCYRVKALSCFPNNDSPFSSIACAVTSGCISDCSACCCDYTVTIGGAAGTTLPGTYTFNRYGCIWTDNKFDNGIFVTHAGGDQFTLRITNGLWFAVWGVTCSQCPSTNTVDYTLLDTNSSTTPTISSITTANCAAALCSSTSSGTICNMHRFAQGGSENYDGTIDFSAGLSTSSSTYYFNYNTFRSPDRIEVYDAQAVLILDSGCVGTNTERVVPMVLSKTQSPLHVVVQANCAGVDDSSWYINLTCNGNSSSSNLNSGCDTLCCQTYTFVVSGLPAANGTYVLTGNGFCNWSGPGTIYATYASITTVNGKWQLQIYAPDCSHYWTAPLAGNSCPPTAFGGWTHTVGTGLTCGATPTFTIATTGCDIMTIEFAGNSLRSDLNSKIVYPNLVSSSTSIGENCFDTPPWPPYVTFSGDDENAGASETYELYLGDAIAAGQWSGTIHVPLFACWDSAVNNPAVDDNPWTYNITVNWKGVKQTVCCGTYNVSDTCCDNQVCMLDIADTGTFTLNCSTCDQILICNCDGSCSSCVPNYSVTVTGATDTGCAPNQTYILSSNGNCSWIDGTGKVTLTLLASPHGCFIWELALTQCTPTLLFHSETPTCCPPGIYAGVNSGTAIIS